MNIARRDSTKEIFNIIRTLGTASRRDIAARCPLSLMSIGKAVDTLTEAGLIINTPSDSTKIGRHAAMLSCPSDEVFVVVDITSHRFTVEIYNLNFKLLSQLPHAYNEDFYFEENLSIFADRVTHFLKAGKYYENCIGGGIIIPGRYDENTDSVVCSRSQDFINIKLNSIFSKKLNISPLIIEDDIKMGALFAVKSHTPVINNALYLKIDEPLGAVLIIDGRLYRGAHCAAGSLSRLVLGNSKTVGKSYNEHNSFSQHASVIAQIINNFICAFDPEKIILESKSFNASSGFSEAVTHALAQSYGFDKEKLPEILLEDGDFCYAKLGLATVLLDRWLDIFLQ